MSRHDPEHPADQMLRKHVLDTHNVQMLEIAENMLPDYDLPPLLWAFYKGALSVQERCTIPIAGPSVGRRTFQATSYVYSNARIRSLICFTCNQIKLDTGRIRSEIEFRSGSWFFSLPIGSLKKCHSMFVFGERYRQPGTALAMIGNMSDHDVSSPDFEDWQLRIHPQWFARLQASELQSPLSPEAIEAILELSQTALLCCPEDHQYIHADCLDNGCFCVRYLCVEVV